jgi:hypothetical protein
MALPEVVLTGCEFFIVSAAGGTVFYFVKGALRSSSKGCRLAGDVQKVITDRSRICRWAAWFSVMVSIEAGMVDVRQVHDPLNIVAAWGGVNALLSVHRGTRAAILEGLKGAAYSVVVGLAAGVLMVLLDSPETSN